MHFYQPADPQPCYYCVKISDQEETDYPIREGIFTVEQMIFRCSWHAQFECSRCGKFHHFSWLYWCPKTEELTCGSCNKPSMKPVRFWDRTYAYEYHCKTCDEVHYDLFYSEFRGTHPWQTENFQLNSIITVDESWKPIWQPVETRKGGNISIEDALKLKNRVVEIRLKSGDVNFHSQLTPEDKVDFQDTQIKWEEISKNWVENYSKSRELDKGKKSRLSIIETAFWKALDDVQGLKVLDAGCGSGYFTRRLAKKGAKVYGVDFSEKVVEYCKKREEDEQLGCKFSQASLTDLALFENNFFDLIVSNTVFMGVQDYLTAFLEISRVLKKDGRFVWSNPHPTFVRVGAMDLKLPFDTHRNEEKLYKIIDRYFDSGGTLIALGKFHPVWQFDRTLSEYSRALKQAGFVIREIIEPKLDLEMIKSNPKFSAFDSGRYPNYIIYDCIKLE